MNDIILTSIDADILIHRVAERTVKLLSEKKSEKEPHPTTTEDPLNDLIEKKEIRGKIASSSTLWKWEKEGKIRSYGIGGKRYYKRSELMEALTLLKK
ncbi:helix-turn-helix domain-containing protein [Sinomicrobium kalidii]|uniref:helix-turn-helix domain-containing protein n=1 Tax=Sinomicrobium kalidii TaxID=2900738 RepID=UPI001E3AF46F|nr:helix-turn-helix domain-containing protein [Sinomicrobium kalidii]UGU17713.1 helix-turn-helix domain-containing protein [Sinomicrobium kalidii]